MSDRLIEELRTCTGLDGVALDQLVADLGVVIRVYRDHAGEGATRQAKDLAAWYADVAETWERLAALAENRPSGAIVSSLPDVRELTLRALHARADAKLHACVEPPNRPDWPGKCRDWLAQQARTVIERHNGELSPVDLRRAIKVVLDKVGAHYPGGAKDAGKFNRMMQSAQRDKIAEEADVRARGTAARIDGKRI
jgi:hypothetical protein